jgi:cell division protein FtsW (lipid II flippase)
MAGVYFLDYSFVGRYPKLMWFLLIAALLAYAPFGKWINNQMAYIYVYSMLFIPLYGGILYAYRNKGYTGILKCLLFVLMAVAVEAQYIDKSAVYLSLLLSCLLMLLIAVSKNWFATSKIKAAFMVIGWVVPVGLFLLMDSGGNRLVQLLEKLQILWKPEQYAQGYQISLIRGFLSGSKLFGSASEISFQYLSGYTNDFILAYIICRWGIVPGIFMIALFTVFIGRMIYISLTRKNSLGMLVGLGCSLVFAVQSVVYILSNLGFRIIDQVTFPFVSFGGAGIFINFIVLGLMMSVFRNTNLIKEVPYKEKIFIRIE